MNRNGPSVAGKTHPKYQATKIPKASSNQFVVLSSSTNIAILEEAEFQKLAEQDGEAKKISRSIYQTGEAIP